MAVKLWFCAMNSLVHSWQGRGREGKLEENDTLERGDGKNETF
jgi:hypothetical protein